MSNNAKFRLFKREDLKVGQSRKFKIELNGTIQEGFVVNLNDSVVAYQNVCRHLPISLDFGDGQILTQDGSHFICATHGALYEPQSGLCVAGPCAGLSLDPIRVVIEDEWIVAIPE